MGGVIKSSPVLKFFKAAENTAEAKRQADIATAAAASVPSIASIAKMDARTAAGKWGKGSFLQRSTWLKGQAFTSTGGYTASTNFMIVPGLPCLGTGVGCTQEEFLTTRSQVFRDKDGAAICFNLALFTATFVAGSPNFTITAWRQGNGGLLPPGAPSPLTVFGTSDPVMVGMPLKDDTNGNNSVIPANACVGSVPATVYATGVGNTYTMVDPAGAPINAVSGGTINVVTGGQFPGVPIIPPASYNATIVDFQMTYAGTFGFNQNTDDLDFAPFNFANVAEMRSVGGSVNTRVLRSSHHHGYGLGDLELRLPLLGRNIGVMGDSYMSHQAFSKTLAEITRSRIIYRAGIGGRQPHEFFDGCAVTASSGTNWNGLNSSNGDGVAVAADFNGLDFLLIGCLGNSAGFKNGTSTLGNDSVGGTQRQPYPLGTLSEYGAACCTSVTSNGTTTLVVNSFVSKSALNPTLVGLKFPATATNGLAGCTIVSQSTGSTGGAGNYMLDSATGVGSGTQTTMIGSFSGTIRWIIETLLAFNVTNGGRTVPVFVDLFRRFDLGSTNGGYTSGTFDFSLTSGVPNFGNPVNSISLRYSDYYAQLQAILDMYGMLANQVDIFKKSFVNPFNMLKMMNSDYQHFNDVVPDPIGDRAFAQMCARTLHELAPLL